MTVHNPLYRTTRGGGPISLAMPWQPTRSTLIRQQVYHDASNNLSLQL